MSTVVIQKYNETHIKILCEKSVAYDLRDRFSFFAPNYKHHPKFKKRLWDGRIYLFSTMTRLIYKGLFNEVVEFLEDVGCKVEKQYQPVIGDLSFEEAKSLYSQLGGKYDPYDHQVEFLQTALNHRNAVLLSATSSGKSFSIYALARVLAATGKKGLIVVPTINLVNQLYKDFLDYSMENGWNVNENVHLVFQGQEKNPVYIKFHCDDGNVYTFEGNQNIKIINSNVKYKKAKDITTDDEIDNQWLREQNRK